MCYSYLSLQVRKRDPGEETRLPHPHTPQCHKRGAEERPSTRLLFDNDFCSVATLLRGLELEGMVLWVLEIKQTNKKELKWKLLGCFLQF